MQGVPGTVCVYPTWHAHSEMFALAAGDVEKAGQVRHVVRESCEYVPRSQSVHVYPREMLAENFPAGHLRQRASEKSANKPGLHSNVQFEKLLLLAGASWSGGHARHCDAFVAATVSRYLAAEQGVQGAMPVESLYLPASHILQGPPGPPVYPSLHMQSLTSIPVKTPVPHLVQFEAPRSE